MSQDPDHQQELLDLLREIRSKQIEFQRKFDELTVESIRLQQYTAKRQTIAIAVLGVMFLFATVYLIFLR